MERGEVASRDSANWSGMKLRPVGLGGAAVVVRIGGIAHPLLMTPSVSGERVAALRRAFDLMMKDPDFLAAAGKAKREVNPLSGVECSALLLI